MVALLQAGEAILMAGAGSSAKLYPDWLNLIHVLCEEALQFDPAFPAFNSESDNYLTYADKLKECMGADRFYNVVYQCFKPKNPGEKRYERFHQVLCRFLEEGKLKGITTTNYDPVFEDALNSITFRNEGSVRIDKTIAPAKIFEFLFSLNKGEVPKRILHLHGVYDERESIILSGSEYQEKYGFKLGKPASTLYQKLQAGVTEAEFNSLLSEFGMTWTQHRKILWSLFATRRLIFMGFSLSDPYFNQMLESVSKDLHTYGYDNHFLILRIKGKKEKERAFERGRILKRDYGIETVFFEDDDNGEGLSNFVLELDDRLNGKKGEPVNTEKSETSADIPTKKGNVDLNQRLINLSRQR